MPKLNRVLLSIGFILIPGFLFCERALADTPTVTPPITATVDGGMSEGRHLECMAYLHSGQPVTQGAPLITLHFFQPGAGMYTTYFDPPWAPGVNYYLTLEKPGITPNPADRDNPRVDRSIYDYTTTKNLITCAQNALYWADNYLGPSTEKKIILGGHSEGTVIVSNALNQILSDPTKSHLQSEIKAIFLSGVAMDEMPQIVRYQLQGKAYQQFMHAYQSQDDDYFYSHFQLGWYWMYSAMNTHESVSDALLAIENFPQGRKIPIEIFQGLLDKNVPYQSVIKFEDRNEALPVNQQLLLSARYYETGHDLDPTVISDMELLMGSYFQSDSTVKPARMFSVS